MPHNDLTPLAPPSPDSYDLDRDDLPALPGLAYARARLEERQAAATDDQPAAEEGGQ